MVLGAVLQQYATTNERGRVGERLVSVCARGISREWVHSKGYERRLGRA